MSAEDAATTESQTVEALSAPAEGPAPHSWRPLSNPAPFAAGNALLLTDGSIMVQDVGSANWWKLTPDAQGSYANGTWSQLASMPDGYAPLYFASAVLPDGRVIVEGGEYLEFNPTWTNRGAIYDPVANTWTEVAPPSGWSSIGDAQSVVLADGTFMVANALTTEAALLDPKTLTWTITGGGKGDRNDEEGWTLLPSGQVLTADANNTTNTRETEIFSPPRKTRAGVTGGTWASAGTAPVQLADLGEDGEGSHEMGPQVLRPDGTVFVVGATGHTAIYDTKTKAWASGPDFPLADAQGQLDSADGPGTLMPNGNVLMAVSAGVFNTPAHFFEYDGQQLTDVGAPANAANDSSYNIALLPLPSGEVLETDFSPDVEIYTPSAPAKKHPSWAPVVALAPLLAHAGSSYPLLGLNLNGVSQSVGYGDDFQAATNYPLVRITNLKTGHVAYSRTHGHTYMGVAKDVLSATTFDIPAAQEPGLSLLEVVANGTASLPIPVLVK